MEEADGILVLSLRQIGCKIPEEVSTVKEFTSAEVVAAVSAAFRAITDGHVIFPKKLPANVAARHRVCTAMAEQIKDLGYTGETGYNQLLYPNEKDTRRLLQFLVHRLPKSEDAADVDMSTDARLNRHIQMRLAAWIAAPWVKFNPDAPRLPMPVVPAPEDADLEGDAKVYMPGERERQRKTLEGMARKAFAGALADDVAAASLEDAVATARTSKRDTRSAFAHAQEFTQEKEAPVVDSAADKGEDELEALQAQLAKLEADTADLNRRTALGEGQVRQLSAALAEAKAKTEALERAYLVQKKTLEMLPEADKFIKQLKEICAGSASRLVSLAAEWETHRMPLLESIRDHKESHERRRERCRHMVEEVKRMRTEMTGMGEGLKKKEERVAALAAEYERMPKETNRGVYTRRIMDIIKQVRKQTSEITSIISTIRVVQRDINFVNEKLSRTVRIAEEEMYNAASLNAKDPAYVESFRNLTELQEVFNALIETVTAIGHAESEQRELETRVDGLKQKSTERNMARIVADIRAVQAENATLAKQIAAASGKA